MKKIRNKLIIMIIIIIVSIAGTVVQADNTNSFNALLTPSKKTIKPGEEITITLSISDINMGEDGINTLEGTIKYDKEIFETVTSSNIKSLNNWTTTYNNESSTLNGKFLVVNLSAGVKENTKIFEITLKAKKDIDETTTTAINFKDITSNNGSDLVSVGTRTVNITIEVEKKENENNINQNNINNDTNNNMSNSTEGSGIQNTNKTNTNSANEIKNTQSSTKLPYTGKSTLVVIAIVVMIIIAIFCWIRNSYFKGI